MKIFLDFDRPMDVMQFANWLRKASSEGAKNLVDIGLSEEETIKASHGLANALERYQLYYSKVQNMSLMSGDYEGVWH